MDEAKRRAKNLGANKINIRSDPTTEKFYKVSGGVQIGSKASEITPGRLLMMFQISL